VNHGARPQQWVRLPARRSVLLPDPASISRISSASSRSRRRRTWPHQRAYAPRRCDNCQRSSRHIRSGLMRSSNFGLSRSRRRLRRSLPPRLTCIGSGGLTGTGGTTCSVGAPRPASGVREPVWIWWKLAMCGCTMVGAGRLTLAVRGRSAHLEEAGDRQPSQYFGCNKVRRRHRTIINR
jgi:hypothetical protein